jgi:alpha-D-ribose 1-methylphosphonate 5-triphosphate synthase subunit PhnG
MARRQRGRAIAAGMWQLPQTRTAIHRAALAGACLLAALLAQWALDRRVALGVAAGVSVAAGLAMGAVADPWPRGERSAPSTALRWMPAHSAALASLVVLGAASFHHLAGNRFHPRALMVWLPGFALLGMAAWSPEAARRAWDRVRRCWRQGGVMVRWQHMALLGAMALAAFLRFYRLHEIPLEMGCDLPHNYDNIRQILEGEAPIFFPSHPGREGLFFYLAAPIAAVFGLSHTTIKAVSALIGVLTVPVVYAWGKELCDREVGLVAAIMLAVSHWHVTLTRVGYRAAVLPPVLALMWLFFSRALRTGSRVAYALAGLFLGLVFYTYNAAMVVPLLVVLLLVSEALAGGGRRLAAQGPGLALLAMTAAWVLIPLARYVADDPYQYTYRVATRLTDLEQPLPADLVGTLWRNACRALAMFTYEGDAVFVTNVAFLRQLGYVPAVGFALGIGCCLWRWRDGGGALLGGLGVMLLPSMLALAFPQEVPSAVRAIGALPVAMLLAAVGLVQVRRTVAGAGLSSFIPSAAMHRLGKAALAIGAAAVVGAEARATGVAYFRDYVWQQPDHNYSISLEMARTIAAFGDAGRAYILTAPYWYDGNAVRAQLGRAPAHWDLELAELVPGQPPLDGQPGQTLVIVHPRDAAALEALRAAYAQSIVLEHTTYDGTPAFLAFYGER